MAITMSNTKQRILRAHARPSTWTAAGVRARVAARVRQGRGCKWRAACAAGGRTRPRAVGRVCEGENYLTVHDKRGQGLRCFHKTVIPVQK